MLQKIVKNFIRRLKDIHANDGIEIISVIGFGSSFQNGAISDNSDIDLYIIINDNGRRYRGVMIVDGVKVDYFAYPIAQLQDDWQKVKDGSNPRRMLAYMLRDGQVIEGDSDRTLQIRKEARDFLETEREAGLPSALTVLNKYFISDYLDDIRDAVRDKDTFAIQYNASQLLNLLIETFCRYHKIPVTKPKYQRGEITKRYPKFVELFELTLRAQTEEEYLNKLEEIANYCLQSMDGGLHEEWELVRNVNIQGS